MPKKLEKTFIDLFAGCGGLSLGLEQADFTPLMVNELSPQAMDTYLWNRKDELPILADRYSFHDIKSLVKSKGRRLARVLREFPKDYGLLPDKGQVDLLVGGPPCQGYSGIGHRRSYSVDKKDMPSNHLFEDMIFVIRAVRPKIFLFENVRGLLSAKWSRQSNSESIWQKVYGEFSRIDGYSVSATLIHAKEYGVPQNRPRVFLVGIRSDLLSRDQDFSSDFQSFDAIDRGFFPAGTNKKAPNPIDVLGDLVDFRYERGNLATTRYPRSPRNHIQEQYRTDPITGLVRDNGSALTCHEYSNHKPHVRERFDYLRRGEPLPPRLQTKKFAQRVIPKRWDEGGPSITITSLPDDYIHFGQSRALTVRECARLQTFPDWYHFCGNRTTGGLRRAGNPRDGVHDREVPQYTQVGNAVPVALAYRIGRHFSEIIGRS